MLIRFRAALAAALWLPAAAMAQPLTLEDAIRRSLAVAPQAAVATARTEALTAARNAAGLRPQPTIEVSAENFGPPDDSLYDQFQITGTYSQRLERGGKREARVALVDREIDIARSEALIARLDLIATVNRQYVEVQAAEAAIDNVRQRLATAQEVEREVRRRVASARDPIFAGTRAKTAVAEAEVDLELAIHARDAALARLTAFWNGTPAGFAVPVADFLTLHYPPAPAAPSEADLAVIEARAARADASIALQRANGVRDPTVSVGPRYLATGDVGLIAGVSLPIGGRRLNEARIAEAEAERRRIDAERSVEILSRERQIALAAENVEETRHEAEAVRERVIPRAEQTLQEVRFGYNRGFFSFTDVAAAQTTLTNARARLVEAARRHHDARVDLDRLTGRFTNIAQEASR